MKDPRFLELEMVVSHRHADGTWGQMEAVHHSSTDHDTERRWGVSRLFRCRTCPEEVAIGEPSAAEGADRVVEDR